MNGETRAQSFNRLARGTALASAIACGFVFGALICWMASRAILAVLVAVVLAVLIDAAVRGLGDLVSWRREIRLSIVLAAAALCLAVAVYFGGSIILQQAGQFFTASRRVLSQATEWFSSRFGDLPLSDLAQFLPDPGVLLGGATAVATASFGAMATALAIVFLAIFFAWDPESYKAGFLSLLPRDKREPVDLAFDEAAEALRKWMIGQAISMAVIFAFTLSALLLIGMPYPGLLALQAGLLTFIPTIGPFGAGIVIILAGLSQSFTMALYGLGTYALIQFLESHLLTPMVQERTVHLPPGLTLGAQLVAATLFGVLGLAFAVPITAAAKTMIARLYIDRALGGPWQGNAKTGQRLP
jgi:predicted PurR-regulated permease PerM